MRIFYALALVCIAFPSFAALKAGEKKRRVAVRSEVASAKEVEVVKVPIEAAPAPDTFSATFEYDADFPSLITTSWRHAWSDENALLTSFLLDSFDFTLIVLMNYEHLFGSFALRPGFVTTFGTASWNGSTDKSTYIFRDVGPCLEAVYDGERFHFETSNFFLIPTQENHATAVWLGLSRFMAAVKWNEYGVGPRFELYYSKEGAGPFQVVETRIGGSVFKHWEKTSIEFFLGYNPTSTPSFLGKPLPAAPIFRVSFAQAF